MLLSTRPPIPHRVRASNDTRVIDEINSNNRASNFEPAIRIIVEHLNWIPLAVQIDVPFYTWTMKKGGFCFLIKIDFYHSKEKKYSNLLVNLFETFFRLFFQYTYFTYNAFIYKSLWMLRIQSIHR